MATLDWSQCPAVESVADRRSGAWVFRETRTPVSDEGLPGHAAIPSRGAGSLEIRIRRLDLENALQRAGNA